jgi:DNA-binding response OmpR family regulator
MKVLIIDDDQELLDSLAIGFRLRWPGSRVLAERNGEAGYGCFVREQPDLVVLDLKLPDRCGLDVLRAIRHMADVPVLILSGRGAVQDQVRALELGADMYMVKPCDPLALMAHAKALLRRASLITPVGMVPDFVAGDLAIDYRRQRVTVGGETLKLSPIEYQLLYQLVRNAGRVVTLQTLLENIWGASDGATREYPKVYIRRLRLKIDPRRTGQYIETVRGLGYRFKRSSPGGHSPTRSLAPGNITHQTGGA